MLSRTTGYARALCESCSSTSGRWLASVSLLIVLALTLAPASAVFEGRPQGANAGFVADRVCAGCHDAQVKAWRGSHHDQAMQIASEETVLGDFADARFRQFGAETRFFRKGNEFYVNTEGPDGKLHDYKVSYTFGVDPLQQYLLQFPGGRLQVLAIAWDVKRKRWYSLYPNERIAPGDALHTSGIYQNWNAMCAECHSTNLDEGYDPQADTFNTTWSELNVGCQACHGPGNDHLEWVRALRGGDAAQRSDKGLVVNFAGRDGRFQVEQCARCHSRRDRASADNAHGRAFMDDYVPATLGSDLYHADGQIDGEVYVYGSFVQSRMHAAGVRCSDCHEPHALTLKATGNALCTRCHQEAPDARFPGLQARSYDSPAHHFHAAGSTGAQCVSCHMPGKTYMGIDFRRDHSFRIPRPDVSQRIGTPNACTGCHDDKTPAWAAAAIRERFGDPGHTPHYGETLAAARSGEADAATALTALADDATRAAIVRATALGMLGNYGRSGAGALARALSDADPLVRLGALRGLAPLPPRVRAAGASKLIRDPVRAVRAEAAGLLAPFAIDQLPNEVTVARAEALKEQAATLRARAALPGGRLALGVAAENEGEFSQAERHYRRALDSDRHFLPARFNLANLLNRLGRNAQAEQVLQAGLQLTPDEGELHYSLALLLAEEKRMPEAVGFFERAVALLPGRSRVRYNHALALERVGRYDDSFVALQSAHQLDPRDVPILEALTINRVNREQWRDAQRYAKLLRAVAPGSVFAHQTLQRIEAMREYGLIK